MTGPSGAITWEIVTVIVLCASGILGIWFRIERRIQQAETALQADFDVLRAETKRDSEVRFQELIAIAKDLTDYKLAAAREFASAQHMKEVEVRLTGSIDRLTNRIESLPREFAEQVARILSSRHDH